MTQGGLWDKTQQLSAARRNSVLAALVDRGLIRAVRERTASRPRTVYFASGWQAPALEIIPPAAAPADDAPAVKPYDVIALSGTEDDEFYARARWLERRQADGEELAPDETRWLSIAQSESWYRSLRDIERWHEAFWKRKAS